MLLVVWTEKREDKVKDCWQYADTYEEASQQYDYYIKRDNTWAVSICSVIKSTDYDLSGTRIYDELDNDWNSKSSPLHW